MVNQSKTSIAMRTASARLMSHVNTAMGPTVPCEGVLQRPVASSQESKVGHSVEVGL